MGRRALLGLALVIVLAGAAVAVTGLLRRNQGSGPPGTQRTSATDLATTPAGCAGGFDCALAAQFTAATALIAETPGHVGIVVRDRVTGAQWHGGDFKRRIWAGSTPKLALTVALLEEHRAGEIVLSAHDRTDIAAMLSVSDNNAADRLWNRYAKASTIMKRFQQRYGMTTAGYVSGFPSRWGFVKCTSDDLANLMAYILTKLDAADRTYLLGAMRTVDPVQRWGVWAAGADNKPGVKDGWSIESDNSHDHWITATVGFAGPDERYIVAAMYHQEPGGDTIERGVHVLSDLVATVFGQPVPATVEQIPPPD